MALIPFDDRDGVIWMNGEMVDWRDAQTHTLSHALHYGSQVFEGERAYGGNIFKSREHTQRLRQSCRYLDFWIRPADIMIFFRRLLRYQEVFSKGALL